MKVYGQLERAQVENLTADPTGTGLVSGRVWFNSTVGEYKYYDGSATQVLADLASAQTLLLKTLTDPTFDASTIYEAIATPAAPSSGVKIYAKSDDNIYVLNSAGEEIQLGSGSGGGLDTYYSENFDRTQASDLSYGSNATFLTGSGLESAQAADETSSPISGSRSLSYTQVSGSLDDWGALPAHTLDNKQKGNTSGLTAYTTYSGDDDDMQLVLYDVNTSAVLDTVLVKASTTPLRHFLSAPVPAAATSLRIGYQVLVENIGAKLVLDDIELSTSPFNIQDVIERQQLEFLADSSTMTSRAGGSDLRWGTLSTSGDSIISYDDANGRFTALKDCEVDVMWSCTSGTVVAFNVRRNGTVIVRSSAPANNETQCGTTVKLAAGDYLTMQSAIVLTGQATLQLVAEANSPHLVTPAKVNLTEWTSYTPTFGAGFSATSSEQFYWKRVGSDLMVRGRVTATTVAASNVTISIPSGLTIDSSVVPNASNSVVGKYFRAINSSLHGGSMHIASSSTTAVNFGSSSGFSGSSANALNTATGTGDFANGDNVTLEFRVPIAEWAGASTEFLAALPYRRETIVLDGSGDITTGTIVVEKVFNQVMIAATGNITHTNGVSATTAVGVLPTWARPKNTNKAKLYLDQGLRQKNMRVNTAGTISFFYFDGNTGAGTSESSTDQEASIEYLVE
jgi:hypothetical protein